MNILRIIMAMAASLAVVSAAYCADSSDKMNPKWMTSALPTPKSQGYIFMAAQGTGHTLDEARQHALINLTAKLEHERGLTISSTVNVASNASRTNGRHSQITERQFTMECTERGKNITLTTRVIDEYWEQNRAGEYVVTELFTVNDNNNAGGSYNDDIRLTTSYGAAPVVYSLIPGVGQFVKGSYLKGGLVMGGTVVGAVATILCENQRADYAKKMREKPQHFDFYRNRKSQWETGRNVAIGVTAAIYIYNLIDAAVAPGRRQVKVKQRRADYAVVPTVFDNGAGMTLAINF